MSTPSVAWQPFGASPPATSRGPSPVGRADVPGCNVTSSTGHPGPRRGRRPCRRRVLVPLARRRLPHLPPSFHNTGRRARSARPRRRHGALSLDRDAHINVRRQSEGRGTRRRGREIGEGRARAVEEDRAFARGAQVVAEDASAFSATQRHSPAQVTTAALSKSPASAPLTASSKELQLQPSTRRQSFGVFSQTVELAIPRCRKNRRASSLAVSPPR